jgi:thiaminase (transcriptional activator TenA)
MQRFASVWEAIHQHPFLRALSDGSLDEARFQGWLRQDHLFLIEYARLFALAAARAGEMDTMKWMIGMAHGVLTNEMLLHRAYAFEYGLPREELEGGTKLPTTRAYTDHLLRTASLGAYLDLVAALLPRMWGCSEIAGRLAKQPNVSRRYGRWVDAYSGPVAANLARGGRDLLDRLARGVGPERLAAAEHSFGTSTRYELMFWQMCWQGENWPG